jgi:hypothetical protein
MREIFADFARLQARPDLGLSVLLGREDRNPELAGLVVGERMLLVEPGDLHAVGIAACIESGGIVTGTASCRAWTPSRKGSLRRQRHKRPRANLTRFHMPL